jgi:PAS domain S-box-containing protein
MSFMTLRHSISTLASGQARAGWPWKTAAALGPIIAAFVIQYFVLNATMARWALFYPAVFVASWLGGLSSGLAATAIATALVPVFFMGRTPPDLTAPSNIISIFIFVTMGIAISVVHERLRTLMAQLERSRRWLQAIMDNSPNVIVIKEMTGRYLMVNRQFEEMLHLAPGAATDKTDALLFSEASADQHRRTDAEVFAKRGAITYEETLQVHGESRVFLTSKFPLYNSEPYPFALCAIWSDITERKRAEEALREREADLRQAERVAHLGSWMWNVADDTSRWSEELYRITGIEPPSPTHALVPGAERDLMTPEIPAIRDALRAILRDGRPHETEMEITRPDGTTRWIAARGEAVRNERGEIVAVAGTAQDITELKELQRQRDEWTSVMAHDLRQPIGVITMAASALPEVHAAAMPDKENEMVARIASAAKGLARLVDDLLDLSLLEARRLRLDRHWIKPQTLVREAVERLSYMADGQRVMVTEGQGLDEVCVDQMRIGQVLGNLISNAVKYGEKGSDIVLRIEQHGAEVDIAVENRGAGIPAEDVAHIFKRFARSAKARRSGAPGLGVGLYIAKELVEAHGGRIWVESTPGQTTTFHFAIPSRAAEQKVA